MRRALLAALVALPFLVGCSGSNSVFDGVTVSGGKEPKVKGIEELSVEKTEFKVLKKGDGDTVEKNDTIQVNYVAVNGRTGEQFASSFEQGKAEVMPPLPGLIDATKGQQVGARMLIAVPPKEGVNRAIDQYDLLETDTIVFLVDIKKLYPREAWGTPQTVPSSIPTLELDKDGHPKAFKATPTTPATATKTVNVAIKGDGPVVESGQTVLSRYLGTIYPDGAQFDSAWDKQAVQFDVGVGGLIKCWDEQLVGQTVGSRLILTCPADVAYGDQSKGDVIKPGDTLIFQVDLLAVL